MRILIQTILDTISLADCARACLENNLAHNGASGSCVAWDLYGSTCELASMSLASGKAYTDETRAQVNSAFYGELNIPTPALDYTVREITNCAVTGATPSGAATTVASSDACETNCETANWGAGATTTPPTACGSWTYKASTKSCTLYSVSSTATCATTLGSVSGFILPNTDVLTRLVCPAGTQATNGGITCPFINDFGNTRASYDIQDTPYTDPITGLTAGWVGMCTYSDTFTDFSGNALDSQVYYNPISLSVTCCA